MQIDGNTPITLTINLEMAQTVLTALGSQPYDRVANLVNIIQQQATSQIEAAKAAPVATLEPETPAV